MSKYTEASKFASILAAENEVRTMATIIAFRSAGLSDHVADQQDESLKTAKARLIAMLSELTPAEMVEFGDYRVSAK